MDGGGRHEADQATMTTALVGRLSGALWVASGLLVAIAGAVLPFRPGSSPPGVVGVGVACVIIGAVVWCLPWYRWRRSSTLWLIPLAFGMITLHNRFTGEDGFVYPIFFFVVYVWIGMGQPRGTGVVFSPLLAAAYVLPLMGAHTAPNLGIASALYVVPACIVLGEAVAWVGSRLRSSEAALIEAEGRFRSAFEDAPIGMGLASVDGHMVRVNRAYGQILGTPRRTSWA